MGKDVVAGSIGQHDGGVQGTSLPERGEISTKKAAELDRVHSLLSKLWDWTQGVKDELLFEARHQFQQELRTAEQEARDAKDAGEAFENYPLTDFSARYAELLRYIWVNLEEKALDGVAVMRGFCVHEQHSWFQIRGDAEVLDDPKAIWLFDPDPRGLGALSPQGFYTQPLIVVPHSPFHLAYRGGVV